MAAGWQRLGIQTRVTAVGVVAVAAALSLAALGLVVVLNAQLVSGIRSAVDQRASDIAAQLATDDKDAIAATLGSQPEAASFVQVVDSTGRVVFASPAIEGAPRIAAEPGDPAQMTVPFLDNEPYLIAAQRAVVEGTDFTVVVAQSVEVAQSVVRRVAVAMVVTVPLLSATVGLILWLAVGRSLDSVEDIRQQVESITSRDLHQRVPVPPAEDEIRHLAETMNHMLIRLDDSARQQQQFVADASHELKSPLASMRATLDVSPSTDPVLDDEVERMTRIVDDLVLLARSDEGVLHLDHREVDLDDLVLGEVSRLRSQTELEIRLDLEPARVIGDRDRLRQVLRNLTVNAARHARGTVVLQVGTRDGAATMAVSDDGPGIDPADRERVFDRFVRLDEHRSRTDGGAGLGLAICREIIHAHGGDIWIEGSAMGGAQVRVSLPSASSR